MTIPAYAISANSLTAETFRQAPSSLFAAGGVINGLGAYATSPASMNVGVNPGQAWVPGTLAATTGFPTNLSAQTYAGLPTSFNEQGMYYAWFQGGTVTIAAADPTNPRIDIIVLSVQDAQYSGSNNQMVLQVITGTPAPSPVTPTAPASSIVIAGIYVPAGSTSVQQSNINNTGPLASLVPPALTVAQTGPSSAITINGNGTLQSVNFTMTVNNIVPGWKYLFLISGYETGSGSGTINLVGAQITGVSNAAKAYGIEDFVFAGNNVPAVNPVAGTGMLYVNASGTSITVTITCVTNAPSGSSATWAANSFEMVAFPLNGAMLT